MFLAAPHRNKLLVDLEAFKTVDHRHFERKQLVKYQDKNWVVLPHDDHTNTILYKHGLKPPTPIESYYTWPGRYKPFKHQLETAKFLATHPRCFCFNEMGTGKTMASLWAADYLLSRGIHKSVLIISPLSTINSVWGDTLWESFHHRKYQVLYGSPQKRLERLSQKADFYIINHDGIKLKAIKEALLQRPDISLVILDEGAVFRNQSTDRYKALWELAGPTTNKSIWWLTGAPMPKEPTDIWAQARMINPTLVPRYFSRFRNEMMTKVTNFKWVPKKGWERRCYAMVKPSIRYTTDQCLDLPPMTYTDHVVGMSKDQAKAYKSMVDHFKVEAREGQIVAVNEAVRLNKLLQIANGAAYTKEGEIAWLDPKEKLAALEEIIEDAGRKVIVFGAFKSCINSLEKELRQRKFKVAKIYGDTAAGKRDEIFREFQHGDIEVLVAHPQCMAHGVTLTSSSTIVWFAPIDNYEIYEQANARIRRAGQVQHQNVIHLICSDVERLVFKKLKNKEKTQGVLMDLLKES